MLINHLLESYMQVPDVKIIGKELLIQENIYEVVGLTLRDEQLELILFEYNQADRERIGRLEEEELARDDGNTNRANQIHQIRSDRNTIIDNIREVIIDGIAYQVTGTSGYGGLNQDEDLFLLAKLFEKGWRPKAIGKVDAEQIYRHLITLEGTFEKLPQVHGESKIILKRGNTFKPMLVEQSISLEVGEAYEEKIYFEVAGEKRWIYINAVKPYNILEQMLEQFSNPKYLAYYTRDELNKLMEETTRNIKKYCPDGKCFILVEYESDTDECIGLFSKAWLDLEVIKSSEAMFFGVRPDRDRPLGKLGKQMKTELLTDPFDEGVKHIEAEIFSFFKRIEHEDITF